MDKLSLPYQREKIIQFPTRPQRIPQVAGNDLKCNCPQRLVNDLKARLIFFPNSYLSSANLSTRNRLFIFKNIFLKTPCSVQFKNHLFFFTSSSQVIHPSWRCYWAVNLPRYLIKERPTTEQD